MEGIIGVAWFGDEVTYRRALSVFSDAENMPDSFADWRALVGKQCGLIQERGDKALRVDIDPATFADWCVSRGFAPNSQGRIAYTSHAVLEYLKTGEGNFVE